MGVPGTVQWAAWVGEYVTFMLIVLIIMTVLLCLPVTIANVKIASNDTESVMHWV